MAGGISPQSGAGMGAHQQSALNKPTQKTESQIVSPQRGDVSDVAQRSDVATRSDAATEAVQIADRPKRRALSAKDLNKTLMQLGFQPTQDNKDMASLMMKYGMELSKQNFDELINFTRGKQSQANMESAIIAKSKGVLSEQTMTSVSDFLFKNQHIGKQSQSFLNMVNNFQMKMNTLTVSNPVLLASLSSVLNEFSDEVKKLNRNITSGTVEKFRRGGLVKDLFSFIQLLKGIEEKYVADASMQKFLKLIQQLKDGSKQFLDNLSAQSILSKSSVQQLATVLETFAFWQVPNVLGDHKKTTIDILVKKEKNKKDQHELDPKKTKMIVNLETPELGLLSMILVVRENKIWYTFNAERESTVKLIATEQKNIKDRMASIHYEMAGFQTAKKKIDIKKYMLPTLDLENVVRIDAEI
tara:strand:+ start:1332 stop:2573 length:1242 start_codon:yes stop_codon:yes gene_type:complete